MGHRGTVLLRLVLLPDGSIGKVSLAESSGTQTLDAAALAAGEVEFVNNTPDNMLGIRNADFDAMEELKIQENTIYIKLVPSPRY